MEAFLVPLRVQKGGNAEGEYEDAFHPPGNGRMVGAELRFAIADGASEGMLSGAWARILVELHGRFEWTYSSLEQFLERAYQDWRSFKSEYLRDRKERNHPVHWYEEPGLPAGAFSTLLGLTLTGSSNDQAGQWTDVAIADRCLFQVRVWPLVE